MNVEIFIRTSPDRVPASVEPGCPGSMPLSRQVSTG